jgi:hypothetical protein
MIYINWSRNPATYHQTVKRQTRLYINVYKLNKEPREGADPGKRGNEHSISIRVQ